jgi:glyceraldehyde 3-phosphate dehydrogenase
MSNINSNPANWLEREKNALEILNIAGKLWLEDSVELIIFRRSIVDARASEILNHHEYARNYINEPLTIENSVAICKAIANLGVAPSKIDIGMLGKEWLTKGKEETNITDFVKRKLSAFIGKDKKVLKPKDVVLYGFGRIGRLAARLLISQTGKGEQLRLKAIVNRTNSDIDYTAYGIEDALLIDNSGVWRDAEGLSQHLKSKGISKVLLTAPGKGDIPNIVYGVNHNTYAPESHEIFSAASCTTNGIAPVLAVIEAKYGLESGHIESVHSYTNDQNLLDNFHKKYRRGRSAPLNMVITETGAAKAVSKVLPQTANKFTGNSVRVPTPDVSLAILNLNLSTEVESVQEINDLLNEASAYGDLVEQIDYSKSAELVSTDCIGNNHASIVDSHATLLAPNKKGIVLYVWYDNEYGYTCQVVRLAKYLAKVQRLTYY